ncbi:MAG: SRPBCC family protein [Deltaproteobacteria bacterium]|nr:SRPBCC family protein [Deltaproteobacteria bacterium]MDZ4344878.1 SRPBCC family protein [Candidatus Binatia bacterium]
MFFSKQEIGTGRRTRIEVARPAILSNHYETNAFVAAPADSVLAYADDPARLSSHMSESSWMMGGGRMQTELDAGRGQTVGLRIRLSGRVFGIELSVEEIVTERIPPKRKVWETIGSSRLLVIGHYRMGFEITSQENGSLLRVFIDYALPEDLPARWLGFLLGRYYARWCTQQMVRDTAKHFASFDPKSPAPIR